jgi:pSer/pThr/pTyr-binding forkhead associated (FHA) protein
MSDVRFLLRKAAGDNEIEIKDDLAVGRGADNALKLTEGNPSRHHARFTLSEGALYLEDLKSTNGTFVNGTRIDHKMRLAPNDKIRFDLEEFVLRVEVPTPPIDSDKTEMRVVEEPAPEPSKPEPSKPEPSKPEPAKSETSKPYVPPAWTDTNILASGNKTVFKSIEQMEEERKRAHAGAEASSQLGPVSVPTLTLYDGSGAPMNVPLHSANPPKSEWSVGCDEGRDIRIVRDGVSGLHAKIVSSGKSWKVVDQVSGNGTFVNGKRVTVSYLQSGDRIAFGPAEGVFQAPESKGGHGHAATAPRSAAAPMDARRKRGLLIVGLSFLGSLLLIVVLLKWLR